jgi:GTPase SAR1 family protein
MATHEGKFKEFGKFKGFVRKKCEKIFGLTICGTELDAFAENDIDWSDFSDFKIFMVYMNKLTALPERLITRFEQTVELICIQNNYFQKIPEILTSLPNLQHLNMHGNYLSSIPQDFKRLKLLERVYLGDNDLVSLPNIFDGLPNLKEASFTANCLTRLPPSFLCLKKLENLDISNNAFTTFPVALLQLTGLKYLNIKRNKIQRLSPTQDEDRQVYEDTHKFFKQLVHVQIELNPISKHKALASIKDITQCLKDKATFKQLSETVPTRSVRVNVLGDSGAGKTSVVEAFTRDKHVIPDTTEKEHRHTVGIDRHYFPVQVGKSVVLLHIWDHAGDNEYAMMNDLFITDNSLVWLVVDLSKYKPNSKYYQEHIGKWFMMVISHNLKPTVWIICTHKDALQDRVVEERVKHMKCQAEKLCENLKANFQGSSSHVVDIPELSDILVLTNTYSFRGRDELIEKLESLSSSPSFSDGKEALQWEGVMDDLHEYAEDKLNNNAPPVIFKDSGSFKSTDERFLKYYNDIGEIFLLESPSKEEEMSTLKELSNEGEEMSAPSKKELLKSPNKEREIFLRECPNKEIVVLNLGWMINLLKQVYHHEFDEQIERLKPDPECDIQREVLDDAAKTRRKHGTILESILKALWKCDDELFPRIIDLFVKFNLTYQVPSEDSSSYFFPHLKQEKFQVNYRDFSCHMCTHITVIYTFACHMPQSFLQRLALEYWGVVDGISKKEIFEDGFKTEFATGVTLHVSHTSTGRAKSSDEEVRLFAFCDQQCDSLDDQLLQLLQLWKMMPPVLNSMRAILTRYWKVCGQRTLYFECPNCVVTKRSPAKRTNNYAQLMMFAKDDFFAKFCCEHRLFCKTCGNSCHIHNLVPSSCRLQRQFAQYSKTDCPLVKCEKKFSKILCDEWAVENCQFNILNSANSLSSYVPPGEQFSPPVDCTDNFDCV